MQESADTKWRERNVWADGGKSIPGILERRGIPRRYQQAELAVDFPNISAKFSADENYYVVGPPGSGKTHLICSMLKERVLARYPAALTGHFYPVEEMLDLIRGEFERPKPRMDIRNTSRDYDEEEQRQDSFLTRLGELQVLALDDLGSEKLTDWVFSKLYQIINYRYNHMLLTYISSQYTLDQLTDRFGDARISSRLLHMCRTIELKGKDRRRTNKR